MTHYIQQVQSENTGGGNMVDFVILKDGRVLGIDTHYVCLYDSMDDFWNATSENKQTIYLTEVAK